MEHLVLHEAGWLAHQPWHGGGEGGEGGQRSVYVRARETYSEAGCRSTGR